MSAPHPRRWDIGPRWWRIRAYAVSVLAVACLASLGAALLLATWRNR